MKKVIVFLITFYGITSGLAQQKPNDVNTPLHLMKPDYPIPYGAPAKENVKAVLDKVFSYLDAVTPAQMINKQTGEVVIDINTLDTNTIVKPGDFRLTSYEWGVTFSAMQRAGETTGDGKYSNYVKTRFDFLSKWVTAVKQKFPLEYIRSKRLFNQPIDPHALDDARSEEHTSELQSRLHLVCRLLLEKKKNK